MTNLVDSFTDSSPVNLAGHTADSGQSWSRLSSAGAMDFVTPPGGFVIVSGAQVTTFRSSWVPGSADYDVTATLKKIGSGGSGYVAGRLSSSLHTGYFFGYNMPGGYYEMGRYVNNVQTPMGTNYSVAVAEAEFVSIKLEMRGTSIIGYVGGVARVTATDSTITAAGFAGVSGYNGGGTMHFDSMGAQDVAGATATFSGAASLEDLGATGSFIVAAPAVTLSGDAFIEGLSATGSFVVAATGGTFTTDAMYTDVGGGVYGLRANQAINFIDLFSATSLTAVLRKTGLSTNAAGIASFTDAALVPGTFYRSDIEFADGKRIMPLKVAT